MATRAKSAKETDYPTKSVSDFEWISTNIIRLRQALAYRNKLIENPTLEELEQESRKLQKMFQTNLLLKHLYLKRGNGTSTTVLKKLEKEGKSMLETAQKQNKNSSPFN